MALQEENEQHWFAVKVFHNRLSEIEKILTDEGLESYVAMTTRAVKMPSGKIVKQTRPLMRSLMFFRSTFAKAQSIERMLAGRIMIYRKTASLRQPAIIPDEEMRVFMLATASGNDGMEYLGADTSTYSVGQQVLVTDGPFKGTIGRIFRIKGDKRLVVTIDGVCAVATSYIPGCFLQKI